MADYRIYLLDAAGSKVAEQRHDCADDKSASSLAIGLLAHQAQTEVWQEARCVGFFSAALIEQAKPCDLTSAQRIDR